MSTEPEAPLDRAVPRASANGADAFVHHRPGASAHLADATWGAPEYEYDHVELPLSLLTPGQARRWAEHALPGSGLSAVEYDDITLMISELVTNAVRHGPRDTAETVVIHLAASSDCIRIEVSDRGPGFVPGTIKRPSPETPGGRGLFVIDALANRWGVAVAGGHSVWLERER